MKAKNDLKCFRLVPDRKPIRVCTKEFLLPAKEELDDSYLATAVLAGSTGPLRAGFSLHDGEHTVSFKMDIRTAPDKLELAIADLKRLDRLIDIIISRLTSLKAAAHKAVEQARKRSIR